MDPNLRQQFLDELRTVRGGQRLVLLAALSADLHRPPNWRWELMQRDRYQAYDLPDPAIRGAAAWFLLGCPSLVKPHLVQARRIALGLESDELRDEIQSRVLARQKTRDIARLLRLKSTAVLAYERLYFDVRSRLKDRDFIHTVVLRTDLLPLGHVLPAGWLWRAAAYLEGLPRLEQLLTTHRGLSPAQQRAGVAGYLLPDAPTDPALRDWITRLLPAPSTADSSPQPRMALSVSPAS